MVEIMRNGLFVPPQLLRVQFKKWCCEDPWVRYIQKK